MKRLFIAVPVQEQTRKQIVRYILSQDIARKMPVRWTPYENLHLTLQFLGDVEESRIPELRKILDQQTSLGDRQVLSFSNLGAFPNTSAPNIIWLGFKKSDYLEKLQRLLTFSLVENGFSCDHKKFKPHMTIGRVKNNAMIRTESFSALEELAAHTQLSDTPLDRLTLFESQLRPGGPIYTALYEKKLY